MINVMSGGRGDRAAPVEHRAVSVRPRADRGLDACVRGLAGVREADGHPVNWPARPGAWLTRSETRDAAPATWRVRGRR
ncbi:hypothetical protein [Streptomyces sp. G45]|uniref:hypothetical protein n=1 Tax=Streptomyces sp. G45 TaxID=3406627 RepID=UPI003C28CC3E